MRLSMQSCRNGLTLTIVMNRDKCDRPAPVEVSRNIRGLTDYRSYVLFLSPKSRSGGLEVSLKPGSSFCASPLLPWSRTSGQSGTGQVIESLFSSGKLVHSDPFLSISLALMGVTSTDYSEHGRVIRRWRRDVISRAVDGGRRLLRTAGNSTLERSGVTSGIHTIVTSRLINRGRRLGVLSCPSTTSPTSAPALHHLKRCRPSRTNMRSKWSNLDPTRHLFMMTKSEMRSRFSDKLSTR